MKLKILSLLALVPFGLLLIFFSFQIQTSAFPLVDNVQALIFRAVGFFLIIGGIYISMSGKK